MASEYPYKDPNPSPTNPRMHPSNPFFTPAARGGSEPSLLPTSPSTPENRRPPSTNPFRRARDTPMPTSHSDEDSPCSGSPVISSPSTDSDSDSELLHPDTTAGAAKVSPLASPTLGSPQELESTAVVPMSSPIAAGSTPVNIRARRSGRRGLNLHVHWPDHEDAAAAPSSSSTPAPQPNRNDNEQPAETATTTPQQPPNSFDQPPGNPPNQPPAAPAGSEPGANLANNNMFFVQHPHVAYQGSVPMIMTNPPYVMPRQTPLNWGPWCYPKQCQSPFWTGTAHHLTSRPMYIHTAFPGQGMPAAPIYQVGPQNTYYVYH